MTVTWVALALVGSSVMWSWTRTRHGKRRAVEPEALACLGWVLWAVSAVARDHAALAAVTSVGATFTLLAALGCRVDDPRRLFRSTGLLCRFVKHRMDLHYRADSGDGAEVSAVLAGDETDEHREFFEGAFRDRTGLEPQAVGRECARCGALG